MSNVEGFGDPKHGTDRKGFPEGLKDGVQEHRVLPPILSQREFGKYVREHTCHYGYGTKMSNSDKEFPNPFYCVEEGKFVAGKFVVTQECPECQAIKMVKSQKDTIEADMKKKGASDQDIAAAVASHAKWLNKHNRDFKFYVNVKDAAGRFFTVKYPSKNVWKPILALIEKHKNSAQMPIDGIAASQGLWFRITRSGKGFKTEYSVELVTEDVVVNGQVIPGAQKPKLGPLTAEDAQKASASCLDLGDVGIRRLSVEQVQRLVSSKGDPNVIAAIFQASEKSEAPTTSRGDEEVSPDIDPAPAPEQQAPPTSPTPITAPPGNPDAAALLAQARALMEQAKAAQAAVDAATKPAAPVAPPVQQAPVQPTPPAPVPAPVTNPIVTEEKRVQAPSASDSAAEQAFLSQFNFG